MTTVRLGPLSADESRRLLAARSGLSESQRTAVAARAGGNPLFLEQLAVHVAERRRTAVPPARAARAAGRPSRPARPAGAIAARRCRDRGRALPPRRRAGARRGRPGRGRAAAAWTRSWTRELLLPARAEIAGEQAWRFRHALVRDAAYASMPKAARAHGHERLADWLASDRDACPRGRRTDRHAPRAGPPRRRRARTRVAGARSARRPRRAAPRRGRQPRAPPRRPSRARSRSSRAPPTARRRRPGARRAAARARRGAVRGRHAGPGGGGGGRRRSPSASGSASRASAGEPPSSASACTCSAIPRRWTRTPRWPSPAVR